MDKCPKCGGTVGTKYVAVERNIYFMPWGGEAECVDSEGTTSQTMPECMECGHRFRWSTIQPDPQP